MLFDYIFYKKIPLNYYRRKIKFIMKYQLNPAENPITFPSHTDSAGQGLSSVTVSGRKRWQKWKVINLARRWIWRYQERGWADSGWFYFTGVRVRKRAQQIQYPTTICHQEPLQPPTPSLSRFIGDTSSQMTRHRQPPTPPPTIVTRCCWPISRVLHFSAWWVSKNTNSKVFVWKIFQCWICYRHRKLLWNTLIIYVKALFLIFAIKYINNLAISNEESLYKYVNCLVTVIAR